MRLMKCPQCHQEPKDEELLFGGDEFGMYIEHGPCGHRGRPGVNRGLKGITGAAVLIDPESGTQEIRYLVGDQAVSHDVPPEVACPFCGWYVRAHQWIEVGHGADRCSVTAAQGGPSR